MRRRILLIEDEESISEPLERALGREGFDVATAATAAEGRERFRDQDPDLVLLDVMLPDGDGRDLLREIRSTSRTPVVMLTARGEELERVLGLELGADDYVTKPFGGSLEIVESDGSTFVFLVSSSTIGGDVKVEKTTGFGLIAGANVIGGNVQIAKSGEHRLLENQVAGNVQVVENTGSFSTEIARNSIGGTLQCEKNVPPPIGGDNVASKKEGQCASL